MVNRSNERVMIQCRSEVKKNAVRREVIDGIEHIIVSSSTLPDNIVMNGGLYSAGEIEKGFQTLEGTLAPVEHPSDADGNFISATSAQAINGFHAGAFNANVRRENGRVHIDKIINVQTALQTDRGKRLLDRIVELETNADPRPIHTSVAAYLDVEFLDGPRTNAAGQKYEWIAKDMVFDHDAILLDSVGAAQPHQGVGVAVNGKKLSVNVAEIAGNEGESFSEIHLSVMDALERSAFAADWIEELFPDRVIFWSKDQLFEVPFVTDGDGISTIVGIPVPVEREVSFNPVTNSEGDPMKDLIINALKEAGIETDDRSDDQLYKAHVQLMASEELPVPPANPEATPDIGLAVSEALKPLTDKLAGLEAKLTANDDAEVTRLADIVANSGKFPGLDAESAKLLGVDKLGEMAGNTQQAYGVSPIFEANGSDDTFAAPTEMPE